MPVFNEKELREQFYSEVSSSNYKQQALILIALGDNRLEEAINLVYSINLHLKYHYFAKSSSLYNAALVRIRKYNKLLKDWQEKSLSLVIEAAINSRIADVEQKLLNSFDIKMNTEFSYLARSEIHRTKLIDIRENVKKAIDSLDGYNPYNLMSKLNTEIYKRRMTINGTKSYAKEILLSGIERYL